MNCLLGGMICHEALLFIVTVGSDTLLPEIWLVMYWSITNTSPVWSGSASEVPSPVFCCSLLCRFSTIFFSGSGFLDTMVKLTMIARVTDGLPLAEGLDDGRDQKDADFYKQQAKLIFKNLSKGHHEASRMSIETGAYFFQYPCAIYSPLCILI